MNTPNPQNRLFKHVATAFTLLLAINLSLSASNKYCQMADLEFCNLLANTEVTSSDNNYEPHNFNTCTPKIKAKHQSIFCLDYANHNLIQPTFEGECSPVITNWTYKDEYLNLNCSSSGFEGYFQPNNWTISKIYGDGGVDVTGAPNVTLVEGANTALIEVVSGSTTTLKIIVPANGIATFDWTNFGGSKFFYSLLINGKAYPFAKGDKQKGFFRSPVLSIGNVLEFQLKATEINSRLEISNFSFYSNATGLVKRHWSAKDENGNLLETTQLISINKANITDVIFPANRDNIEAPALESTTDYTPYNTGYPFIDRDSDLSTTDDQYLLEEGDCTFNIEWKDQWNVDEQTFTIERRWLITDWCTNSILEGTQIIKLNNLPAMNAIPESLRENAKASDQDYEQTAKPITGLLKMVNPGGYGTAFRCKTNFYSLTQAFPSLREKLTVAATFDFIEDNTSD